MNNIKLFENKKVRTSWDEEEQQWYFSIIDIVEILTNSSNPRDYWFKMKIRIKSEDGLELSTTCRQLKLKATDGKMRETDVANTQTLLRIIQSIPSPKAEPFKQWLAKVGYERMREIADPEQSLDRARENWQKLGRSEKWIQQRMTGQETRNKLTDYWQNNEVTKSDEEEAKGVTENAKAGKKGGTISKNARRALEQKTGKKVVTGENFLPPVNANAIQLTGKGKKKVKRK
jgi:DNA-damage-inducible protein D